MTVEELMTTNGTKMNGTTMTNTFKKQEVFLIDYKDFDNFIIDLFDIPPPETDWHHYFTMFLESPNDVSHTYKIDKKEILEYWEITDIDHIKKGQSQPYYAVFNLLCYLCMEGLIEEGTYVIKVSW